VWHGDSTKSLPGMKGLAGASSIELAYSGVPPIATCHWQWVGNILAARGFDRFWEKLGLSWGFRWRGGSPLFGSGRWPEVLREVTGITVEIRTFDELDDALEAEWEYFDRGAGVVVEVDEYFLPDYLVPDQHVVHAVLVIDRSADAVHIVDSQIGTQIREFSAADYSAMRSSPCEGRVESHKLYAVVSGPTRNFAPSDLLDGVRSSLRTSYRASLDVLGEYLRFARETNAQVDVCRAAGERFQAARLFEYLASEGVVEAHLWAEQFTALSDRWYLIHMLSTHERANEGKNRRRILQMLEQLAADDSEATEAVIHE